MLPKAHGLVEKPTENSPDNVDLRNIVSRMRSVSGPDISSFQQTYVAAISNSYDDEADVEFGYGGHEAQPERPFADEQTAIEPIVRICCRASRVRHRRSAVSPRLRSTASLPNFARTFCARRPTGKPVRHRCRSQAAPLRRESGDFPARQHPEEAAQQPSKQQD